MPTASLGCQPAKGVLVLTLQCLFTVTWRNMAYHGGDSQARLPALSLGLAAPSHFVWLSPRASRHGGLDETVSALPSRCFDRRRRLVPRLLDCARSKKRRFRDATQTSGCPSPAGPLPMLNHLSGSPVCPPCLPANRVTGCRDRSALAFERGG